jgi:hypothetical protein
MIAESDKQMAIALMDEAMRAGARASKACHVLGLSTRTLRRWRQRASLADARKDAAKHCPQALSNQDRQHIIAVCNTPEHQSLLCGVPWHSHPVARSACIDSRSVGKHQIIISLAHCHRLLQDSQRMAAPWESLNLKPAVDRFVSLRKPHAIYR